MTPKSQIPNLESPMAAVGAPAVFGHARRAFSFTEILFAVMILGIGFIMVAAMFPVALQQTENSTSDTIAANVARSGVNFVNEIAQTTFVSAQQPTNTPIPDQNLCALTPTVRVTAGAKTGWNLWLECYGPNGPDVAFRKSFPQLGPPPLSMSQTIPGEVWALDANWATYSPSPPYIDEQVRAINSTPITSNPLLFKGLVWPKAAQNMIQTGNARYAWVAFYKRDVFESLSATGTYSFSFAPYAQVIVVALQCRNADAFASFTTPPATDNDLTPGTGSLEPMRYAGVQLIPPPSTGATSTIIGGIKFPGTPGNSTDRSAPGAFVIIANDDLNTNNPFHGRLNGHVFRLGNRFNGDTNNTWEFVPGFTLTAGDVQALTTNMATASFTVYMLGMGRDPNSNASPKAFGGPAMDVAVYSSFIPCSTN